jgi:hypothetical protein
VRHLPRHAHFAVQLRQASRVSIHVRRKELERDRLPELQIVGSIHFSHAAASEPADDAIAAPEQSAGRKRPWSIASDDESQPLEAIAGRGVDRRTLGTSRVTLASLSGSRVRSVWQRGQSSAASSMTAAHAGQEGIRCSMQRGDSIRTL